MKKDEFVKLSNSEMKFIKENQESKCPVVQAIIDRIVGTGPELDILPAGAGQTNPIQDVNMVSKERINKNNKKYFKDREGNILFPIDKIESFGHIFILFKYENSNCFRPIRRDKVLKTLEIITL